MKGLGYCTRCGSFGKPTNVANGSFGMELFLWFLLLPGLIYSLWRLTTRQKVCRFCGGPTIPEDSPVALAARRAAEQAKP